MSREMFKVPLTDEGRLFLKLLRRFKAKGVTMRARGRGKRVHGGKRYFRELPVELSERVSVYVDTQATPCEEAQRQANVSLQMEVAELQRKNQELDGELAQERNVCLELQEAHAGDARKIQKLEARVAHQANDLRDLQESHACKVRKIEKLRIDVETYKGNCGVLRDVTAKLNAKLTLAQEACRQLRETADSLTIETAGSLTVTGTCTGRFLEQPNQQVLTKTPETRAAVLNDDAAIFEQAGFTRPSTYDKPDPRGPEYGVFKAWRLADDNVAVEHCRPGVSRYVMYFGLTNDFLAWAKDCT